MNHRWPARLFTVGAAGLLAFGLLTSPALAGTNSSYSKSGSDYRHCPIGAQGRFTHTSDHFSIRKVCGLDNRHGVLLGDVRGDSAPEVVVWSDKQSGSANGRDYNVPEGTMVHVRACIGDRDEGTYWRCGPWRNGRA